MKHISFADKTVFVSDEAADSLVEYTALLGAAQSADSVRLRAVGQDGNEADVDFVLNASTNLLSESTNATMEPPENAEAVAYMRDKIELLRNPPSIQPSDDLYVVGEGEDDQYIA